MKYNKSFCDHSVEGLIASLVIQYMTVHTVVPVKSRAQLPAFQRRYLGPHLGRAETVWRRVHFRRDRRTGIRRSPYLLKAMV